MIAILFAAGFSVGAMTIAWMSWIFAHSDLFALLITLAIGAAYSIGFIELLHFRRATGTLNSALQQCSESLDSWLEQLHPSLQSAVRQRIEGHRVSLPTPGMTPFLTALLVMLGLLGTFIGMIDTLKGAVVALEGSTELEAIRAGLAAPIKGLGLAFGTSVAGVAGSAVLGLASALARRERLKATAELDRQIPQQFREHHFGYRQQQAFTALQAQIDTLPDVALKLAAVSSHLELLGTSLATNLSDSQQKLQQSTSEAYRQLATDVGESLRLAATESGRLTSASITPVIESAMRELGSELRESHLATQRELATLADRQLQESSVRLDSTLQQLSEAQDQRSRDAQQAVADSSRELLGALTEQSATTSAQLTGDIRRLLESSEQLVKARIAGEKQWHDGASQRLADLAATVREELSALNALEQQRGAAASEQLTQLQGAVSEHLTQLGNALEAPMTRLIETASETPKAAAEVIGHLRGEISKNIERDNQLLSERQKLMEELSTLSSAMEQASLAQNRAAELLVNSSTEMLENVAARFSEQMHNEVGKVTEIVDHFSGSAADMASLGDAFAQSVALYNQSNQTLVETLARIEASLDKTTSRSDEQLGYYVAQAREIIDHSLLSQKEVFEEIRKLSRAAEAEAV